MLKLVEESHLISGTALPVISREQTYMYNTFQEG